MRDKALAGFPGLLASVEEIEIEYYEFLRLPMPKCRYIPTLVYNEQKISGSWYGECPVSCRLSTDSLLESMALLDKVLEGKDPIDWIDSGVRTIAVDPHVETEEPSMHGKVRMYPEKR